MYRAWSTTAFAAARRRGAAGCYRVRCRAGSIEDDLRGAVNVADVGGDGVAVSGLMVSRVARLKRVWLWTTLYSEGASPAMAMGWPHYSRGRSRRLRWHVGIALGTIASGRRGHGSAEAASMTPLCLRASSIAGRNSMDWADRGSAAIGERDEQEQGDQGSREFKEMAFVMIRSWSSASAPKRRR